MRKLILRIIVSPSLVMHLSAGAQHSAPSLAELIDSAIHKDYTLANQKIDIELTSLDKRKLSNEFFPRVTVKGADKFLLTSVSLKTKEIRIPELNINIDETRNRLTSTSNLVTVSTDASI